MQSAEKSKSETNSSTGNVRRVKFVEAFEPTLGCYDHMLLRDFKPTTILIRIKAEKID